MRTRNWLLPLLFVPLGCGGKVDICAKPSLAKAVQELSQDSRTAPWVTWNEALQRPKRIQTSYAFEKLTPEDATRRVISRHAKTLHLAEDGSDLVLESTHQGLAGTYLRFGQRMAGLPVFGGEVIAQTKQTGDLTEVQQLNLAQHEISAPHSTTPALSEAEAATLAAEATHATGAVRVATVVTLGIWPDASRLAYRVQLSPEKPFADFEVFVDAQSGKILSQRDRMWHVNGTGQVFDPNAVAVTGTLTLTDNNDSAAAVPANAFSTVTLPRLDGSGFLRGDFADARPQNANQRAQSAANTFNFDRNNDKFEEVMAYFHIDRTQNYIQSLGFNNVNNRRQVAVVNVGANTDNSFYSPGTREITFGAGGVDDAEDGEIIAHEYGHSIQDNQVPGFGGGDEGSMGEGFGDYLASTTSDVLSAQITDIACVGDWDAVSYDTRNPKCLRRVDETKHFPEFVQGEVHADGEMWAAGLFNARALVGAAVMDPLVIEAHFSLSTNETFFAAADAIIAADNALNGGQHVTDIRHAFIEQGLSRFITPPSNLTTVVQTVAVSIDNPRAGNTYTNLLDDSQVFTQAGAAALRLHFTQIATELDAACFAGACDNIYLYDAQGNLFQILNGASNNTNSVIIPGDTVRIRMVSDVSVGLFGYHVDRVDVFGNNGGPFCGDNTVNNGEQCDGAALGGQSCVGLGFAGGTLSCNPANTATQCTFNTSACTAAPTCGNGTINAGEDCDGANLNNQTCTDLGFVGGTLSCNNACLFNTNACTAAPTCGNGAINAGEDCDGANLNNQACTDLGFTGGNLSCNNNCVFNTSACTGGGGTVCGNDVLEPGEQCDGSVAAGLDCVDFGFAGGALSCNQNCFLDESGCTSTITCGNGIKEGNEECDGADLAGQDCTAVGQTNGVLACSNVCTLDKTACLLAECQP